MKLLLRFDLKSGIYKLEWKEGYFYYGQTQDLLKRKTQHFCRLKGGYHNNRKLQRIYNKFGPPSFTIIEVCELICLDERESFYLKRDWGKIKCCNICSFAKNHRGVKRSDETKLKISQSKLGKKLSDKAKKAVGDATRKRFAEGFVQPKRFAENNPFFGKKHSEETKIKMKKSKNVGENNVKARLVINLETGIYYGCITDASKSVSMNQNTLYNMLTGYRKNKTSFQYA